MLNPSNAKRFEVEVVKQGDDCPKCGGADWIAITDLEEKVYLRCALCGHQKPAPEDQQQRRRGAPPLPGLEV